MIDEKSKKNNIHQSGEAMYLTFPEFDKYSGISHLFTTRFGGISCGECTSWNFGNPQADSEENIYENFRRLAQVLKVPMSSMVYSSQSHDCNILTVGSEHRGMGITVPRSYADIDGLITMEKNIPLVTCHADCNSIYFYDPVAGAIGMAHSGWKGTLGHIGAKMVFRMKKHFGCMPENMVAGLGPALCMDCFEVEDDVASQFFREREAYKGFSYGKGIKTYIDLKRIIKYDLAEAGVCPEKIFDMELCTKCNNDVFFSHRGQGPKRGLMAAVIMLRD